MEVIPLVGVVLSLIFIIKSRLISKLLDFICSTSTYKKYFATLIINCNKNANKPTSPLYAKKKRIFEEVAAKLDELPGDILEIGAGSGSSLELLKLPEDCSLVVIDNNPHFEESFKRYAAKFPNIKVKDYLVQSAVDMSNIPDNTFSVVLIQDVLCSIEEESLRKMLKEIKRVLKPVCIVLRNFATHSVKPSRGGERDLFPPRIVEGLIFRLQSDSSQAIPPPEKSKSIYRPSPPLHKNIQWSSHSRCRSSYERGRAQLNQIIIHSKYFHVFDWSKSIH